jgi:hypothetical protein
MGAEVLDVKTGGPRELLLHPETPLVHRGRRQMPVIGDPVLRHEVLQPAPIGAESEIVGVVGSEVHVVELPNGGLVVRKVKAVGLVGIVIDAEAEPHHGLIRGPVSYAKAGSEAFVIRIVETEARGTGPRRELPPSASDSTRARILRPSRGPSAVHTAGHS